ncbi:uncharacterized protein LOC111332033 [Stylophora pistillata]|uniref:uncharacterized protein LOC111332033 n=1 Tax=Stylophora pistillata TaxID=50429 RepID=UPI000C04E5F3|nr:uncharacterized protein LOC111332033 [Stylophora pistillata]
MFLLSRQMQQINVNAGEIHNKLFIVSNRERLEQDRSLKREQESALQKAIEDDKIKESSKIREARQARVTDVSQEGEKEKVTIILNHSNGKEEHQFIEGAFFQEVYDWAGSNNALPLHFSIQRGREVVKHGDLLESRGASYS